MEFRTQIDAHLRNRELLSLGFPWAAVVDEKDICLLNQIAKKLGRPLNYLKKMAAYHSQAMSSLVFNDKSN